MACRGIRGATTVTENSRAAILAVGSELLRQMADANGITAEDIACILFTTTPDLNAEFPAAAARELGWHMVPLMCAQEIDVPGAHPMCLRIMMLCNTERKAEEIVHVYTRGATELRNRSAGHRPHRETPSSRSDP
ncbi:MAG: chorismate mutase [Chloroflexota bacterium]